MGTNWYTSDLHVGHRRVAELRGFDDVEHHDETIMFNWSATVQPDDQVWVLGDLSMGSPSKILEFMANLPGQKHLVSGNHDGVHPMHRRAHKLQSKYLEVFASVQPFARHRLDGKDLLLSHFPYLGDHTDWDRARQWRLPDLGEWLLHGHTHANDKGRGRQVHVGLDGWDMQLVSQTAVKNLMFDRLSEAGEPWMHADAA